MNTTKTLLASLALISGLATAAAAHAGGWSEDSILGATLGGAVGAAIGHNIDGRDGAIVGAAIGGATGAAIGSDSYRRDRYVRREPERIEVIRDEPRYYYAPPRERVIVVREPERPYWRHDNGWHRDWREHDWDRGWDRGWHHHHHDDD